MLIKSKIQDSHNIFIFIEKKVQDAIQETSVTEILLNLMP